jgi:hypothetical protein
VEDQCAMVGNHVDPGNVGPRCHCPTESRLGEYQEHHWETRARLKETPSIPTARKRVGPGGVELGSADKIS